MEMNRVPMDPGHSSVYVRRAVPRRRTVRQPESEGHRRRRERRRKGWPSRSAPGNIGSKGCQARRCEVHLRSSLKMCSSGEFRPQQAARADQALYCEQGGAGNKGQHHVAVWKSLRAGHQRCGSSRARCAPSGRRHQRGHHTRP